MMASPTGSSTGTTATPLAGRGVDSSAARITVPGTSLKLDRTSTFTPNFFATMTIRPPKIVDKPHRHSSAAINYYFIGHGKSAVMGQRLEWEAGDLHLSAPGWAVHNHGSREKGFCALTIQDHPLQIAMESLIWQETLKSPIIKLGSQTGFDTNLGELIAA